MIQLIKRGDGEFSSAPLKLRSRWTKGWFVKNNALWPFASNCGFQIIFFSLCTFVADAVCLLFSRNVASLLCKKRKIKCRELKKYKSVFRVPKSKKEPNSFAMSSARLSVRSQRRFTRRLLQVPSYY